MPLSDVIRSFRPQRKNPEGQLVKEKKEIKHSERLGVDTKKAKPIEPPSESAKEKGGLAVGCRLEAKRNFAARVSQHFSKSFGSETPSPVSSAPGPTSRPVSEPKHAGARGEESIVNRISPRPSSAYSVKPKPGTRKAQNAHGATQLEAGGSTKDAGVDLVSPQESLEPESPLIEPPSASFWKRVSQNTSTAPTRSSKKRHSNSDSRKPTLQPTGMPGLQDSTLSDEHPSTSSELSDPPLTPSETAETSITSDDECGLAGIGIRDRSSISLHSLPARYASPQSTNYKPLTRSRMSYAPSHSSPLSSRAQSTERIHEIKAALRPRPQSTQGWAKNRESVSFGRLNVVPFEPVATAEDLTKILRGPSSYPDESIPRSNRNSFAYNA